MDEHWADWVTRALRLQQRRYDSVVKELASYDEAIAAGPLLPVSRIPPRQPVDIEQRKLFLPKDIDPKEMSTGEYLRHLRILARREKLKVTWYQTQHIAYLQAFVTRARKALDTADSLEVAAGSTTLPRAMGES